MSNSNSSSTPTGDRVGGNGQIYIHDGSAAGGTVQHVIDYGQYASGSGIDPKLIGVAADPPPDFFSGPWIARPLKITRSVKPEQIIIKPDYKDEVIVDTSHGYLEQPASRRLIRICKGEVKQCFLPNDGSAIDYDEIEWISL